MTRGRLVPALLVLAVAIGVLFRATGLESTPPWHDEVVTRIFAAGYTPDDWHSHLYTGEVFELAEVQRFQERADSKGVVDVIGGLVTDDPQHPPVYYVLAWAWVGLFGDRVGVLRALSACAGLLFLPVLYWLAREAFGSARVAWTAVALGAVSPFFVLYAQEAREYALWSVLIALSTASLLRALRLTEDEEATRARCLGAWVLYSLATASALYTSFSSVTMITAHVLFLAVVKRGRVTSRAGVSSFGALAVSALLFLPWALALVRHYEAFRVSMRWSREIVIPTSALLRIQAINASRSVIDLWPEPDSPLAWVAVGLTVCLIAGALVYQGWRAPRRPAVLISLLVAVPIAHFLLPDLLFGGIRSVSARYTTPAWVGVVLALAFLLGAPGPWARGRTALLVGVLGVGIASCWSNARQEVLWTMGISTGLPEAARIVNAAEAPLVIGDNERHNPGNLMALSNLLSPDTRMQFLTIEMQADYVLPREYSAVFLYSPIPPFRDQLVAQEGVQVRRLYEDLHLSLWAVEW